MKIEIFELERFKKAADALVDYSSGRDFLRKSGIFALLRQFARPFSPDNGANPYIAARAAAYSEGYNAALDDLLYFEEKYLTLGTNSKGIVADFGGLALALRKGDLTEKDIKNGKSR